MPTYEYECKTCGHVCDVFHNMNARPRVKCPECGGNTRKRIGAGAGIIFKGSGFYETDYKRKSNESTSRPASEPAKTESKKEEKKTDTAKED